MNVLLFFISKLRLSELKNIEFNMKKIFFIELTKVLEVANFGCLAIFRYCTCLDCAYRQYKYANQKRFLNSLNIFDEDPQSLYT